MTLISIFGLAELTYSQSNTPPSFDCKKAKSLFDRQVCDSPWLCKLDREVAEKYKKIESKLTGATLENLKFSQRTWLAGRNQMVAHPGQWTDEQLAAVYQSQSQELDSLDSSWGPVEFKVGEAHGKDKSLIYVNRALGFQMEYPSKFWATRNFKAHDVTPIQLFDPSDKNLGPGSHREELVDLISRDNVSLRIRILRGPSIKDCTKSYDYDLGPKSVSMGGRKWSVSGFGDCGGPGGCNDGFDYVIHYRDFCLGIERNYMTIPCDRYESPKEKASCNQKNAVAKKVFEASEAIVRSIREVR